MPESRSPSPLVHGLRPALLAAALTLVVAACGAAPATAPPASPSAAPSASPSPSATPEPSPSPTPEPSATTPPGQPPSTEVTASSAPRTVGEAEVITVVTHCGFEGRLDWAGSLWRETGRSPDGAPIGDPEDTGRITLVSATEATFESSTGTLVTLERIDGPVTVQMCD